MMDHDDCLAITADHDDADDDDGGDQEAEQYAHGGDVGDGGRKLAYQRIPVRVDAVFLCDPKGPYSYERIAPSPASQKSGIAYGRIPRTGSPQGEPTRLEYERVVSPRYKKLFELMHQTGAHRFLSPKHAAMVFRDLLT